MLSEGLKEEISGTYKECLMEEDREREVVSRQNEALNA